MSNPVLAPWCCSHRGVLAVLGVFTLTGVTDYAHATRGAEVRARVSLSQSVPYVVQCPLCPEKVSDFNPKIDIST